jgi:hypothetical protein
VVKAAAHPMTARLATHSAKAAVTPTSVTHPAADQRTHTVLSKLPTISCGGTVYAGCTPPAAPTLYVTPVKQYEVGVSMADLPVDCSQIPGTPVTHCEPSDRKN